MNTKKAFFVGVGGIGVSALAKYLYHQGYEIAGSDQNYNENIQHLEEKFSLQFFLGHTGKNIDDSFELLVHSPAISLDNPDIKKAKESGVEIFSYPQFLGKISQNHFTVSVAGTNGKTTTTSMIAEVLAAYNAEKPKDEKKNFFSVVGGVVSKLGSNFIYQGDEIFVVESCEFKRSFLNISPDMILITNITADHLDYYKNLEEIQNTFIDFIKNLKSGGKVVCNTEDKNLLPIVKYCQEKNIPLYNYKEFLDNSLRVSLEGEHNRQNAAIALKSLELLDLDMDFSRKYLQTSFIGSQRRFEFLGKTKNGAMLYDDYAHNPEGVEMIVNAVKKRHADKKIALLFHPHLYSRTKIFFEEFVEALSNKNIDELYVLPIYGAREENTGEISSNDLKNALDKKGKKVWVVEKKEAEKIFSEEKFDEKWVIVFAGAGDGNKVLKNRW